MDEIYLDNNATTCVDPAVLAEMLPFFTEYFGNPSSLHGGGSRVAERIRRARGHVQALLGAEYESEILFTSGGTEANNTALWSAIQAWPERREIIISAVEHPSILAVCAHLEQQEGYLIHRIGVNQQGQIDRAAYFQALSPQVAIVSIMMANNETGTLFPVAELAEAARNVGVLFHTDAVQAVGRIPLALKATAIDCLSLSGHKFHAPKGIGALYLRRGTRFRPLLRGGRQERNRRAGTENVPGIIGLGAAAEQALSRLDSDSVRQTKLRDRLERAILARVPESRVLGDSQARLPNTSAIAFDFVESEPFLLMLNQEGIVASSGAACSSGSLEPSHVLRAMQVPAVALHGAVRFSLSRWTTVEEIERAATLVPLVLERLRGLSSQITFPVHRTNPAPVTNSVPMTGRAA
jgi:cysteine desulfurase